MDVSVPFSTLCCTKMGPLSFIGVDSIDNFLDRVWHKPEYKGYNKRYGNI